MSDTKQIRGTDPAEKAQAEMIRTTGCPTCAAEPEKPCSQPASGLPVRWVHHKRRSAFRRGDTTEPDPKTLSVDCLACRAPSGTPCISGGYRMAYGQSHAVRYRSAQNTEEQSS